MSITINIVMKNMDEPNDPTIYGIGDQEFHMGCHHCHHASTQYGHSYHEYPCIKCKSNYVSFFCTLEQAVKHVRSCICPPRFWIACNDCYSVEKQFGKWPAYLGDIVVNADTTMSLSELHDRFQCEKCKSTNITRCLSLRAGWEHAESRKLMK